MPLLKPNLVPQDLYSQLVGNDTLDLSKQDVIQGLISQWKDKFCTEAVYTPASKNPASFTGALIAAFPRASKHPHNAYCKLMIHNSVLVADLASPCCRAWLLGEPVRRSLHVQ